MVLQEANQSFWLNYLNRSTKEKSFSFVWNNKHGTSLQTRFILHIFVLLFSVITISITTNYKMCPFSNVKHHVSITNWLLKCSSTLNSWLMYESYYRYWSFGDRHSDIWGLKFQFCQLFWVKILDFQSDKKGLRSLVVGKANQTLSPQTK